MERVVDNVLLFLLALVLVFTEPELIRPVLALLFAVIFVAMALYLSEKKWVKALVLCFVMACFFLPELISFLPLVFYQVYSADFLKIYWFIFCAIPFLWKINSYQAWEVLLWLGLCGMGILLARRTKRVELLAADLIHMRDASTELNLTLREKNKNLMEKQDYEIYLATLKERNRIAREIHDNVGHMLSRSILQVGALETIHKEEPLHGQLGSINETLNQAMNSIRESVHDLHDDSIDLEQAIREAVEAMETDYRISIDYDMTKRIPRNVKYCFAATVKEAMSNIVKHSNADHVSIIAREHPAFYQLFVEDNGSVKPMEMGDGIGLSNMRERVEALNGTIHTEWDNGFKIFISIRKREGIEI